MFVVNENFLFDTAVGVALKSTLALCVAWMASRALRRCSAAVRHLVWTAAAAALLTLPLLSVSLPSLRLPQPRTLAADSGVLLRVTSLIGGDTTVSRPMQPVRAAAGVPAPRPSHWRLAALLLWVLGALFALCRMIAAFAGLRRSGRAATPSPYAAEAAALAHEFGIRENVPVFENAAGSMPMTYGILHPSIVLPADASAWSEERRRVVLLHELAHIGRGDVPTQLMARLALILHWWNPLAWLAWREFIKERERAADDLVLRAGARASDYAQHLLEIARTAVSGPALGWAGVAMARFSQLEGRLLAILDSRVNRRPASRASALAAILAALALIAPLAAVHAQQSSPATIPAAGVDVTIRVAQASKNSDMLEKPAATFLEMRQYDVARRLLESALAIHEEVSGPQSEAYGLGLLKLGDLERRRYRASEAEAFYTKAVGVLGDRKEIGPALMYLGVLALGHKNFTVATDDFQKAQILDPALSGPAKMWTALVFERADNTADAEAMYRSALAMEDARSPDHANTILLLARFLANQGRADEAKALGDPSPETPAPPPGPNVFLVKDGATPPKILTKVNPIYPIEAKTAGYSATVRVQLEVGADGAAHNIHAIKTAGLGLDESAIAAIGQWRFEAGTKDGAPAAVLATIEVNFTLAR